MIPATSPAVSLVSFTLKPLLSVYFRYMRSSIEAQSLSLIHISRLKGKNIALIFEKTSTRTRSAFEVAAADQGAHTTFFAPSASQFGHKESVKDSARVLGQIYDAIEYRGFAQKTVEELAKYAGVPVFNGLTDEWHPTQMLCDLLTMREHCHKPFNPVSYTHLDVYKRQPGTWRWLLPCPRCLRDFGCRHHQCC